MMNQTWLALLFALCLTGLVHNLIEIWGMRQKVAWLRARIDGKPHGKWPVNIDTGTKTIMLHGLILIIFGGLSWWLALAFDLSNSVLVWGSIITLLLSYILTTAYVDKFHTEIGKLLKRFK